MTNPEQPRYSMLIQWSNEDNAYLVALPEWQNEVQDIFAHGDTYEEAARNGRECLEFLTKSAKELSEDLPEPDVHVSKEEENEIERKWDELLASPESMAYMAKMATELEADHEAGRLIPGGFSGNGEFIEELEAAMKALIGRVRQGMMVRDQEALTKHLNEFLSKVTEEQ
jgi:predicted RNase H-like HicB family nuclease